LNLRWHDLRHTFGIRLGLLPRGGVFRSRVLGPRFETD
jgi:hypothetical protein